jgi:TDG/mug DNA glycosylase family protein
MGKVHALPDVLVPELRVVFCGTAAGSTSAAVGAYYAGPGNSFWATLHAIALTPRTLNPAEFHALPEYGLGLTDIAKYRAGVDASLTASDFDVAAFRAKIERYSPRAIAFNGKKAGAVFYGCETCDVSYGLQAQRVGDTAVWILPSTSGGARAFWDLGPWRDLAATVA